MALNRKDVRDFKVYKVSSEEGIKDCKDFSVDIGSNSFPEVLTNTIDCPKEYAYNFPKKLLSLGYDCWVDEDTDVDFVTGRRFYLCRKLEDFPEFLVNLLDFIELNSYANAIEGNQMFIGYLLQYYLFGANYGEVSPAGICFKVEESFKDKDYVTSKEDFGETYTESDPLMVVGCDGDLPCGAGCYKKDYLDSNNLGDNVLAPVMDFIVNKEFKDFIIDRLSIHVLCHPFVDYLNKNNYKNLDVFVGINPLYPNDPRNGARDYDEPLTDGTYEASILVVPKHSDCTFLKKPIFYEKFVNYLENEGEENISVDAYKDGKCDEIIITTDWTAEDIMAKEEEYL